MKYLDKNKKNTTKVDARYVLIENGIVLKRIHINAIDLPIFSLQGEFGKKVAILSDKDNVLRKLKNIKPNQWKLIGWQMDTSYLIKIGEWGKDIYELEDLKNQPTANEITTLVEALKTLANEIEPSDNLIGTKDTINSMLKPSELVAEFFPVEFEKQEILLSDGLGVVLDLGHKKGNVSGDTFSTLYRYSGGNIKKLNECLIKIGINEVEVSDLYYVYNINETTTIEFRNTGVFKVSSSGEGDSEKVIIDKPIKLTGWYESNYDINNGVISSVKSRYYYCEGDIIFTYYSNTDGFNKKMGPLGIRMQITGQFYQTFYSALDKWIEDEQIKEFQIIEKNGIDLEKKIFTHGGELLYNENSDIENLKVFAPKYATDIGEQITIKQARDYMEGYFKKPYQYAIFLWFLGSFLKRDLFKQGIPTPILQVIGFTESGKTEVIQLIMKLFGLSPSPIQNGNITVQPRAMTLEGTRAFAVQNELGDYAPIFFDEFTGNISKDIEEMLRSVYNEKDSKKGRADQTVITYKMLSPIVIGGEKAPSYMSVMNRSIYIQLDKTLQTNKKQYGEIRKNLDGKCVLEDMWNKVKDVDLSKYKGWIDQGENRIDNNYAWLHIVNNIFGVFDKEMLDDIIKEISKIQLAIIEGKNELKEFFTQVLVQGKKEQNISISTNKKEELIVEIYIPPEFGSKNHAIMEMKRIVGDNDSELMNIKINMDQLLKGKDKKTEWIVKSLFRHLNNYRNKTWQSFIYEFIY